MSMKSLRAQSKAGASARLARMSKYAKGGKVSDGDADDKPMAKAKKPSAAMSVDGKPARARLDRPGRRLNRAAGGGTGAMRSDDDDSPVEKTGWLDKGASIASRLMRGAAKPAAKAIEDTGGATGQRIRDLMSKGKSFEDAHREVHPELWKGNAERTETMRRAVDANKAAEAAGKPYPSDEWKALFPERKAGGKVK